MTQKVRRSNSNFTNVNYFKLIILFFLSIQFYAQKNHKILQDKNYKFEKINSDTGLLENTVQSIFQDSQGFMWYGTPNGLYKYDGYNFTAFRNDYSDPFSLSENSVTALFEDKTGLLWVGTEKNLNILDRKTGKFYSYLDTYKEQKEINENLKVYDITQDDDGVIWIATNTGLFEVNEKKEKTFSYSFKKILQKEIAGSHLNVLHKRNNGEILIGTNRGLKRILAKNSSKTFEKSDENLHNIEDLKQFKDHIIIALFEDSNSVIWIGTNKGLFKMFSNKFSNTETISKVHIKGFEKGIQNISSDGRGNIWFGTMSEGLFLYDTTNNKIEQFKNNSKRENTNLNSNSILDLHKDQSGILWIGTSRGGLSKLDLFKKNFIHFKNNRNDSNSLGNNIINSFYEEANQEVWVGTFNGGLNKLSYKGGEILFKNIPLNNEKSENEKVFSLCKDNFGYLWVATISNGLYRLKVDKKNRVIEKVNYNISNTNGNLPTNRIDLLYKDRIGDIWMGSFASHGLMKFKPSKSGKNLPTISKYNSNISSKYNFSSDQIASIFEDKKGVLWVGTRQGLNKVYRDKKNDPINVIQYLHKENDLQSLSNNNVFSIQEDYTGTIWVGTFGGGISKLVNTEKEGKISTHFIHFGEKDGLASNAVYGIIEDNKKNLWISSNNGISKFNLEKNTFTNYSFADGLQSRNFRKFAFHKGSTGILYFGGINGFNAFNPEEITDNISLPKTVITDLKINNKSVNVSDTISGKIILSNTINFTDEIELKYQNRSFSFDFASLHFASPEQNKYAYMLEGYETEWIHTDAKRRFAGYSNLINGDYIFKVKSANKDSFWNDDYAQLKVKVLPPFWKTWWMYLIYTALFFGLLTIYRKYILEKEKYNTQIKLEKFEKEKIKEVNKMKLQFFTNISHEFKTPLTLILGPLEKLIDSKNTNSKTKEMLVLMQRNANQLYKLIQQVLEFRKIENNELKMSVTKIDIISFCEDLATSFEVLADKKNIAIVFKSNEKSLIDWFDVDKVEKILNNLLSNALKFTPKNGKICINISAKNPKSTLLITNSLETNYIEIIVQDNGTGIPRNKLPHIFKRFYQVNSKEYETRGSGVGLALTKSLVEFHGGRILVESQEKKGTQFIVHLPLGKEYFNTESEQNNYFNKIEKNSSNDLKPLQTDTELEKEELNKEEEEAPLVLIVEDKDDMRTFIRSLLSDKYQVLEASNGVEGKDIAFENIPDLIISDVMMPKMDGIELCKELKTNELTCHIPVILLTAKASIENRIEGINIGADAYIPKPFHSNLLIARIKNLLGIREILRKKYQEQDSTLKSQNIGINEYDKIFLEKAEGIVEQNLMNAEFGVNDLGNEIAYSRMQLYRKLKSITGLSANEYIRNYRLKKAALLLKTTNLNISEILYEVGFSNRSYFTKCFKLEFGKTPKEYRE